MKFAILEFIDLLKDSGVKVSLSESLDCLSALEYVDLSDKDKFRYMLKSTLIKNEDDFDEFFRLFTLHFERHWFAERINEGDDILDLAQTIVQKNEKSFTPMFKQFLLENEKTVIPALLSPFDLYGIPKINRSINTDNILNNIKEQISRDKWSEQLEKILSQIRAEEFKFHELNKFQKIFENRMNQIYSLLDNLSTNERRHWSDCVINKNRDEKLHSKNFIRLSESEVEEIKFAIQELVKKIRNEKSLRARRQRRGNLDIKRTIRNSQQYGGIPVNIFWKKKKKSKGRIIALCDVSWSVRNAAEFMLTLLYSLQDQFSKVRSFVFVSEIGEVTDFFEKLEIHEAISKAVNDAGIAYYSLTDYTSVFNDFTARYLDTINSRTTVIILSDGRNNYKTPELKSLQKIKKEARRIIWLNPDSRANWNTGDSEMQLLEKACSEVWECRNLEQLLRFINHIVF